MYDLNLLSFLIECQRIWQICDNNSTDLCYKSMEADEILRGNVRKLQVTSCEIIGSYYEKDRNRTFSHFVFPFNVCIFINAALVKSL